MSDIKHISCFLMGGLGNQLFQIFTTFAYGMNTRRKVVLPYTEILTTGVNRPTYWNNFLSSLSLFTTKNKKMGILLEDLNHFTRYNEIGFRYNQLLHHEVPTIILTGYYQSYLYFDKEKEMLFKLIQLTKQQSDIIGEFTEELTIKNDIKNISMHFRLGDYKYIQDKHPLMPIDYYRKSLQYILKNRPNDKGYKVLYFCEHEDNAVVFSIIQTLSNEFSNITWQKVDDTVPDWKQMLMMSCCQYNIIANSTFSWWAGYFNQNTDKMICYPFIWFGKNAPHDTSDLFPATWEKIEFTI